MKELKDKVAVITGGASGIGRAIADRLAREGVKLVLADIEEKALAQAEQELTGQGATVLALRTDVSKLADIERLAQQTVDKFGAVHLLFNNAGVAAGGPLWECTQADWEWVLGVNLWSVIYGIRVFVPLMLKQNTECHIVNTASMAGLASTPGLGIYNVTKHGVVTLSETLYGDLASVESKIKVSVLCPGWVNTRIHDSFRNRPAQLQNAPGSEVQNPAMEAQTAAIRQLIESGLSAQQVAEEVYQAILDERFYILTHRDWKGIIKKRMENIIAEGNPIL